MVGPFDLPTAETSDSWQVLKEHFNALLDADPPGRSAMLAKIKGEDPELAEELVALLESHQAPDTLLSRGALADLAAEAVDEASLPGLSPGDRIGPYEITHEIGSGGMGTVYLAARTSDFEQRVAIKRVQAGRWGAALERRFLDERQILARLEHANIARLLDGGKLEDGSPYLVMEYIEGQPIDEYCEQHGLTIPQRLELLRTVCSAVQYAHQNLIIHRDLKPNNILVTPEGVPKLLDFGIAKLLHSEGDGFDAEGQQASEETADAVDRATLLGPMTPRYASPEQLRGEPVSTASDVYALGLIAYRLLAGRLPEPLVDLDRERATRPSTTAREAEEETGTSTEDWRRLVGDLDQIILKALAEDARERYASAERFATELERHLEGLPVEARGSSFRYLAWKWASRHRAWLAAAVLLICSLAGGAIATYYQAQTAERERARAERRFGEVRHLANAFLFDFHNAIAELPGSTRARQLVVTTALDYLERLAADSDDDPRLLDELAQAYVRVGDVQGHRRNASLGDTAGALTSYRRALDLLRRPALAGRTNRNHQLQLASVHRRIGSLLVVQGDRSGAREQLSLGLEINQQLSERWPNDPEVRLELSEAHDRIGEIQAVEDNLEAALKSHRLGLDLREQLVAERPADARIRSELATSHAYVGDTLAVMGDPPAALSSYRQALAIDQELADAEPGNAERKHRLIASHDRVGEMHSWMDDPKTALASYRQALTLAEELAAADPHDARAKRSLSLLYNRAGNALAAQQDHRETLDYYLKALELRERLVASDPSNVRTRRELAVAHFKLGEGHTRLAAGVTGLSEKRRHFQQARDGYQQSFEILRELVAADLLPPADRDAPAEMAAHVARCDAELERLGR